MDLVRVHLSLYSNGALVVSQDCALYAADWASMQASTDNAVISGSDGKPIVTQSQVTPEGRVSVAIYQES